MALFEEDGVEVGVALRLELLLLREPPVAYFQSFKFQGERLKLGAIKLGHYPPEG